ncbi:hypothetical protein FK535_09170 [Mycolicibacterium sp. 018/SC-01/001]|uniref:N-acetylmuramoyl-L-alanine amidase n=1 Tax=Mycolicibacterium sp. 018/SC-01/001 TaxID=2592069 RepID=UPI00117D2CC6|nr:N-acetylmuramoyl-L-alanine amidase [Mycolicibacterium sp. 018/SC-01/001]TRW85556.1 hypothetical protein FK535_09170 [Mycolicibacterium sp. 018/SC-01/001]
MYRTKDQVASEFIAEGKRRGIKERGIVICIATGLVESGLTVYANASVPGSLELPHDAVGSDGKSVGPLQQQVIMGNGWWWGPVEVCQDPTKSAGLFYDRLAKLNYDGTSDAAAGAIAQAIQKSAYPDRYATRMAEAQRIYDRLTSGAPVADPKRPDFNEINEIGLDNGRHASVRSRPPMNFFLHTQEPAGDGIGPEFDSAATDLSAYLRSTSGQSAVSYHYTIRQATDGGVTVVDVVDTDLYSWSVLNANVFSINLCFAGSKASWTRDQWMTQSKAIRVAAYLAVQDCKKYNFSTAVILPPYAPARAGISDHKYVTQCLGIGNHTDVGNNFPWDYFVQCVNEFTNNEPVVTQPVPTTPPPAGVKKFPDDWTDRELLVEILRQQRGYNLTGWDQLGKRSLVDAVAELLKKDAA